MKILIISTFFGFMGQLSPLIIAQPMIYKDHVYDERIKTIILHVDGEGKQQSVMTSFRRQQLTLEFDDLRSERQNYYVKLIHCTYDWKISPIPDLHFLDRYNEFPVDQYDFSRDAITPYIHYRVPVPKVKLPGNYILMLYRDRERDTVLTRRIGIYDNQIQITRDFSRSGRGTLYSKLQLFDFTIYYGKVSILDASRSIHVVVRQNQRWDNALFDWVPFLMHPDKKSIEYRAIDQPHSFYGGNEFRLIDIRSLTFYGQHVRTIDRSQRPFSIIVNTDQSRGEEPYSQHADQNGGFLIENIDLVGDMSYSDRHSSGHYANVVFSISSPRHTQPVFVVGAFNNWARRSDNEMHYDPSRQSYVKTLVLKQGIYDYMYSISNEEKNPLEGNYFQTENDYEILVYHRTFQFNTDRLIGYFLFTMNPR